MTKQRRLSFEIGAAGVGGAASAAVLVMLALVGAELPAAMASQSSAPSVNGTSCTPPPSTTGSTTAAADPACTPSSPASRDTSTPTETPAPPPTPAPPVLQSCGKRCPANFTPTFGTIFNHPFSGSASRNKIRYYALKTIKSVPPGGNIRIAAYSINDVTTTNALWRAVKRGVSVQIVVNSHNVHGTRNHAASPSFISLQNKIKKLRYNASAPADRRSFAKICHHSCRGQGGVVHYKMFLFSQAGSAQNITMMGSANLTTLASNGQWNHMTTFNDKQTYDTYLEMFNEMALDKRQARPYRVYDTGSTCAQGPFTPLCVETWFFPYLGARANTDPLMVDLDKVQCNNVPDGYGKNGHTVLKIGAYAWFGERGNWLARKVRSLWNAGCDISIEYAIINNTAKKILYSPSGRGRIPMRQVAITNSKGVVVSYDHDKYVALDGRWDGRPGQVTWTGTTNFTSLGFVSDDSTQRWVNPMITAQHMSDFDKIWHERFARVPSPTSQLPGPIQGRLVKLGEGPYVNMETN